MDFKFPDVGEGLSEGTLVKWLVHQGDAIKTDQPVCEVETDKAVVEIPSPVTGTVTKLHWKDGDVVPVGKVLMTIDDGNNSTAPATQPTDTPQQAPQQTQPVEQPQQQKNPQSQNKILATPATRKYAASKNIDLSTVTPSGPEGRILRSDVDGGTSQQTQSVPQTAQQPVQATQPLEQPQGHAIIATPSVRRYAREQHVDIKQVRGTGEGGRILAGDVDTFKAGGQTSAPQQTIPSTQERPAASCPVNQAKVTQPGTSTPMSGIRKAIAKHLSQSIHTIAQATHMESIDVTELVELRTKEKPKAEKRGIKLTYLAFIIKATVAALKKFPQINSSLDEEKLELITHPTYNVGIAVDTADGLLVPVIKDAQQKSILALAQDIVDLAGKAKERKLSPDQMQGSTFSITNVGSIGGEWFVPIVNYPNAAILGLARMKDQVVVINGKAEVRKIMNVCLSYDHRIIDGADAARFINEIKALLEDPNLLLLDA